MATDDLLTDDVNRAAKRLNQARLAAVTLARENFAGGERLEIDANAMNLPDGDVVFGQLDQPLSGNFIPASSDITDCIGDRINAVVVAVHRSPVKATFGGFAPDREVIASATAMLDWRVIGFRPNNDLPIPLVPIGIYSDHKGEVPQSWDAHCRNHDRDNWRFDPETNQFVAGRDGIPEVTVVIGKRTTHREVPALFLQVGVKSFGETIDQLHSGINRQQLREFGSSGFVLGQDNTLALPGTPDCPKVGQSTRRVLDETLQGICGSGEARIWPLFSNASEDGTVQVTGWMAARVVACSPVAGGGIELTLQPAVVCHPSAVTEHRSSPPAFWAINRTVCRVRLAE